MTDERYKDLPEGCHPPLPPYRGAIFLREGNRETRYLTSWNNIHEYLDQLPGNAIPGQKALIAGDHTIWVWQESQWVELPDESAYVKDCIKRGHFNAMDINYIKVPDVSLEAGITFGGKNRREWTIGNWISHLGGRINKDGYLEFGSIYAFNMMLAQMLRADFKGGEENIRITIDGGTDSMKAAVAMLVAGSLGDKHFTPGQNLSALMDKVNNKPVDLTSIAEQARAIGETEVIIDILPALRR